MTTNLRLVVSDNIDANEITDNVSAKNIPLVIEEAIFKLINLGKLKEGWDSYNAIAPSEETLYAAACLVHNLFDKNTPTPGIFPVPNGNVQIEWNQDNKEVEIEVKSLHEYELYFSDMSNGDTYAKTLGYDFEELRKIIVRLGESNRSSLQIVNA
jgi:hypothetical protein